jgi:AcrR family transcriptional regulator
MPPKNDIASVKVAELAHSQLRGRDCQGKARRKLGSDDSETRRLILDAAEQLMQEEGYAAVTSRRLGAKAGVNAQLIHYYFRSMDNLFLELWRRYTEANIARQAQAFLSPQPLRTLWESAIDQRNTTLGAEIMALARHRKELRAEIARTAEAFRRLQAGALAKVMVDYGLKDNFKSAEILSVLIAAVARILVVENELEISYGHGETRALIEEWIDRLEGERTSGGG